MDSHEESILEDLSKDDLIVRFNHLADLYKTSKSNLEQENINLRKQLTDFQLNNVNAELLDKLTTEKLDLITQIEDLRSKNKILVKSYDEKLNASETANISYNRQIKRLTDENEQLISDLAALEHGEMQKLDIKQKEQHLLQVEKSLTDVQSKLGQSLEEIKKLNSNLLRKETEMNELSQELQALKIIRVSTQNNNCDNNCIKEINKLKSNIVELKGKVTFYHGKLKKFALDTREIKEQKNSIIQLFTNYTEQIKDWREQLVNVSMELCNKVKTLQKNKNDLQTRLRMSEEEFNKFKEENNLLNESLKNSKEEVNKLSTIFKKSMNTEEQLAKQSSQEIIRLDDDNKQLYTQLQKLEEKLSRIENKTFDNNSTQTTDEFLEINGAIDLKRENAEMLQEMNHMNQALKERGEKISQLEAHGEEIRKKLQLYETQANRNVDCITEKEKIIETLNAELATFKERMMDVDNAESDTMSTISRTEEVSRLKDLEGSWEERYGKLRNLAIKLKAKIKQQDGIISELEKEKENALKKLQNHIKTIQGLEQEINRLQDDLEKSTNECKDWVIKLNSTAHSISKDKLVLVENEEEISKLKLEINNLKEQKQEVELWKKKVASKVQTLRKEVEAKDLLLKEVENELKQKKLELHNEQESLKQAKNLLDQSSNECKKNSLLNLEMQDYEKSVKELSLKIEKQTAEITNLQTQLDMQKNTANAVREQNKILEERIEESEKTGANNALEINACEKKILNLEEVINQKNGKLNDVNRLLTIVRNENEELSTELTKVIAEHQKSSDMLKSERDQLRNQLSSLQQNFHENQDVLKLRNEELESIKREYENYKVRAQCILKKNQSKDIGWEEKLTEELSTIKSCNVQLNDELKNYKKKLNQQETENSKLRMEKIDSVNKIMELEQEIEELKKINEKLTEKCKIAVNEHAETVRNLKIHADTLSQCYRQQLTEQEVRHNREIIALQTKLDKAPINSEPSPIHLNNMMAHREEGEGSESVESSPFPRLLQNNVHPIPLERLLDSSTDDEVTHLKKSLFEQESKVNHLTALLSDTEQDLAKHVQMNKLLKEEIRRQQRSVEREKHAENLEYLKNVVFKFCILTSGDERSRLVPVLSTILKLSPDETKKLIMVAKGADPGLKGWANMIWSSPSSK